MTLDKEIFMRDGELAEAVKVGARLPMMTDQGFQIEGKVLDITDKEVVMDFNHPFAGMTVKYDGEVIDVRNATEEELARLQQHGCGCGHCHGGDCGDDCGDAACGCDSGHCHC